MATARREFLRQVASTTLGIGLLSSTGLANAGAKPIQTTGYRNIYRN